MRRDRGSARAGGRVAREHLRRVRGASAQRPRPALAGRDLRRRGRPRLREHAHGRLVRAVVRRPARPARARRRRHARHRALRADPLQGRPAARGRRTRSRCRRARASSGRDFESYRTQAAADDIDDVRRALGFDEITLYGDSYGTYLGQSYAFRHRRGARRAGARLGLPGVRRGPVVPEPDQDRRAPHVEGVQARRELHRRCRSPPRAARRVASRAQVQRRPAAGGDRGRGLRWARRVRQHRSRRARSCGAETPLTGAG